MKTYSNAVLVLSAALGCVPLHAEDWPQWLGPQRDGVWRETGIVRELPAGGLEVRWRQDLGGGYAGPAVAGGRVFVTDRQLAQGTANPKDPFDLSVIPGTERVLCLEERDGRVLWQHTYDCPYTVSYPAGPRTTPAVSDGQLFTLGTEGHLFCFEAASGKVLWSRELKKDYNIKTPLWGFSGHPLVDGDRLICLVGGSNSVVVAFEKNTGRELWRALSAKEPGYCPPVIYEAGGRRQLIVWHPQALSSLDPNSGTVFWSVPCNIKQGVSITMPRRHGSWLLVSSFYNGSILMELDGRNPTARVLWQTEKASEKDTTHLNSLMSIPFFEDGYLYGVCNQGQLRGLKAATGERLWENRDMLTAGKPAHCGTAFLVKHEDRYFICNENGDLILAQLSPSGPKELGRCRLIEPSARFAGRDIVWSHPAFANRRIYARNDKEILCADLAAAPASQH